MVVINENGEVVFEKLSDAGTLSENTINKYNFIEHKEYFNKFIDLLSENYLIYGMIKSLEYKIDDNLELIIFINENMYDLEDSRIYTFDRGFYDAGQESCEALLYKLKLAWKNLNEVERYIIKSLFFDKPPKTDEVLMDEFYISKNKYYIYKKSGIIKLSLSLGLCTNHQSIESMIENKLIWQYVLDGATDRYEKSRIELP